MDRSELIESKHYDPQWFIDNLQQYHADVDWRQRFGSGDPSRRKRTFNPPVYATLGLNRVAPSRMRLNEWKSRYHHPGGLTYDPRDIYGDLNSSAKPTDGYIDLKIEDNPGIFGHGF